MPSFPVKGRGHTRGSTHLPPGGKLRRRSHSVTGSTGGSAQCLSRSSEVVFRFIVEGGSHPLPPLSQANDVNVLFLVIPLGKV
jgi:hypothetical protein